MIISHPDRTIADLSADLKYLLNSLFFSRFDGNSDGSVADPDKAALRKAGQGRRRPAYLKLLPPQKTEAVRSREEDGFAFQGGFGDIRRKSVQIFPVRQGYE